MGKFPRVPDPPRLPRVPEPPHVSKPPQVHDPRIPDKPPSMASRFGGGLVAGAGALGGLVASNPLRALGGLGGLVAGGELLAYFKDHPEMMYVVAGVGTFVAVKWILR